MEKCTAKPVSVSDRPNLQHRKHIVVVFVFVTIILSLRMSKPFPIIIKNLCISVQKSITWQCSEIPTCFSSKPGLSKGHTNINDIVKEILAIAKNY